MPQNWTKLDLLRACCEADIKSFMRGGKLCWRVTLIHRKKFHSGTIMATNEDVDAAVADVVGQAERLGWIRDGPRE